MAFADAEFIDADVAHFMKRNTPVEALQFQLVNLLDHIPTHGKVIGNPANRAESEEIQNGQSKGADKPMLSHHTGQAGPPQGVADIALCPMKGKNEETSLATNRAQMKSARFLSFKGKVS